MLHSCFFNSVRKTKLFRQEDLHWHHWLLTSKKACCFICNWINENDRNYRHRWFSKVNVAISFLNIHVHIALLFITSCLQVKKEEGRSDGETSGMFLQSFTYTIYGFCAYLSKHDLPIVNHDNSFPRSSVGSSGKTPFRAQLLWDFSRTLGHKLQWGPLLPELTGDKNLGSETW